MNKVFVLAPNENWIVDRFVKEWYEDNSDISTHTPSNADVIWLMANWCWHRMMTTGLLHHKKVITTVHHVVPDKFDERDFHALDHFTSVYHVPNDHTGEFIQNYTKKPIHVIGYWANQNIWKPTGTKQQFRQKHGLPLDAYVVGSFQRDTEGAGIPNGTFLPKLEKGPDILADLIIGKWGWDTELTSPIHVVLAGWRRQYVIERLQKAGVPYTYFEKPSQEIVNELYQTLDMYPITARWEGGPQALLEAGLLNVPVVSTPVGMAHMVLPDTAIGELPTFNTPTVPNVEQFKLPLGYEPYRKLIESL